jgi:universal stress protein F
LYSKILVPIDLSHPDKGSAMINIAKSLAGMDLRLIIVNIVEDVPQYVARDVPTRIIEAQKRSAAKSLEAIAQNAGVEAVIEVRSGQPADEILSVAKGYDVHLIIIASLHLLGSTAVHVVRHAKCPVLVER